MYEIKAYKFRIYPDAKREVKINKRLILAQQLYNKIPERIRSRYKTDMNSAITISILNSYLKDAIKEAEIPKVKDTNPVGIDIGIN